MTPTSILFVCLGNICRSPMAESIFQSILKREQVADLFNIDSAGLIDYHQGELPDSRMRYFAEKRGYTLTHRSKAFNRSYFDHFDMIIGMDEQNIEGLKRLAMSQEEDLKIYQMTDFCLKMEATHVPDPYYGGNQGFNDVIDLLEDACEGLYDKLKE